MDDLHPVAGSRAPSRDLGHPAPRRSVDRRRWGALAFVCLAVVVIVMDGSIVNVALPTLARELDGATISRLQWVVDGYILSFAALLLVCGSAADRFGRRRLLLAGLAFFALASGGAAISSTVESLIAWRALMGIGAAMIFPPTLAIITDSFPEPRLRRTAIAIWAGSSGLGVAVGPVVGGWLIEHGHWGAVFLVNLPLVLVAMVGIGLLAQESRDPDRPPFDPLGAVLSSLGVLGLVWAIIEGPERGWRSPACVSALIGSLLLLGAFVAWERRAKAPMLDLRAFADRNFSGGCIAIAAAFFGLFGFVFMVTQYFQFLFGYGALEAGLRTTPFAGFILLGAFLAARHGREAGARGPTAAGLLLMAAGFAWATRDSLETSYGTMVLQMGVLGVGLGLVNAAATEAIMGSLPANRTGSGSSINDTLREVGGTLGVAAMGSAFNMLYRGRVGDAISGSPLPEQARDMVRSSLGAALVVIDRVQELAGPGAADRLRTPVRLAFLDGFRASCWIAAAATLAGALAVLACMPRRAACQSATARRAATFAGHSGPVAESPCGARASRLPPRPPEAPPELPPEVLEPL